jgi:hypothetical protein
MFKKLVVFFDLLEDKVRIRLSRHPIIYSFVGAIGIVLVWKGVWETAELFPFLHGPASFILGLVILLVTGLMVSFFIGDSIILSGFRREKKLVERAESELRSEKDMLREMNKRLDTIEGELKEKNGEENLPTIQ